MSSLLSTIRDLLKSGKDFKLLDVENKPTDDIVEAKGLSFGPDSENFLLDDITLFEIDGKQVPLRVVIQCWLHRKSSAADYLADCQQKELTNVSFLQRTSLLNWLSGASDSLQSQINKGDGPADKKAQANNVVNNNKPSKNNDSNGLVTGTGEKVDDVEQDLEVKEALSRERVLLDHNSSLRGNKPINFSYLIKESELKLVQSLKASLRSKKNSQNGPQSRVSKTSDPSHQSSRKDPIILIPSAASSIFTMANIKQFLQDAQYVNPRDLPASQVDLIRVEKKLDKLSRPMRFIIVNNTRMFTKPEYWDRVVAVFTMGHKWQFNNYQWNTPQELFQHCKGYYFHYAGDAVPPHVQQWNVQQVQLEKNIRFKDVEVARFFWNSLERELIARGYH